MKKASRALEQIVCNNSPDVQLISILLLILPWIFYIIKETRCAKMVKNCRQNGRVCVPFSNKWNIKKEKDDLWESIEKQVGNWVHD